MDNNKLKPEDQTYKEINFQLTDLFELEEIQHIQDLIADTHGVASIITTPGGIPITEPSNFTRLCSQIIRKTTKGLANCLKSDAVIGQPNPDGPNIQNCLSCGLWDAGASIFFEGKHIANWLIGQVRNEEVDQDKMIAYAKEIGADINEFLSALNEVPVMSTQQFQKIARLLHVFANGTSEKAKVNYQLKQEVEKHKLALKQLREKDEKYILIAENTADSIALLDLNLKYKYLSPSVYNLLGYQAEELLELEFMHVTTPESLKLAMQMLGEEMDLEKSGTADPNRSRTIITEQIKKDGKRIWVEATVSFIRNKDGQPINILAVSKDITERKLATEKLSESLEKHEVIIKSAMDGFWIVDLKGGFIEVNDAYCQMCGYTQEELLQMNISELEVIKTNEEIGRQMGQIMQTGYDRFESRHRKKDGSSFDYEISVQYHDLHGGCFVGFIRDISEQKAIQAALLESEWKFQALFQKGPIGVAFHQVIYDQNGEIFDFLFIDANEGFIELTGVDPRGKTTREVFPGIENDPFDWIGKFREVVISGNSIRFEQLLQFNQRWYDCAVYKYKPDHFVVAFLETTKKKEAEMAHADSEERWRRAISESPIPIMIHDDNGKIMQLSSGWTNFSGFKIDDIPSLSEWMDKAFGDDSNFAKEYFEGLFSINEKVKNGEWTIIAKNGSHRIWDFQTTPLGRNNEGKRILQLLAVDITDRKQAEISLRESENFLKEAQRISNMGTYSFDLNSGLWTSSDVLDKIFGIDKEFERSFDGWLSLIHPNFNEFMNNYFIKEVIGNQSVFDKEYQIIRKNDQQTRWVHGIGKLKKNENNQIISIIGVIQDITEKKEAELEIIKAREKAEESDRLKSAFLANMSHEIRTPLNSIIGFSELLNDSDFNKEQKFEFTQTIIEQGNSLLVIINDIIDLSMLEAQKITLRKKYFNVPKLLIDLYNEYKKSARDKGLILKCDISDDLFNLNLKSDIFRVKQIIKNLIINALKFTDSGTVEIGCFQNENSVIMFVRDTGIGISKMHFNSIFDRFRQIENSTTRKYGGNGLGLAISKSMAEIMGGSIYVESEINMGSTFFLSLPR